MKRTGFKHLRRTVQKNAVSFFSVAFIAAVSIAIYLGIQSASGAILQDADRYYASSHLAAVEISCGNGLTQEDVEAVSRWEGVTFAEGGYSAMVTAGCDRENVTVQVLSLCDQLNVPVVLEGSLPQAPGQLAIEEKFASERQLGVGDTLRIDHDGSLTEQEYTICAIINHPAYCCGIGKDSRGISQSGLGAADYYAVACQEDFDSKYFGDAYTAVYADIPALDDLYTYSREYEEKERQLLDAFGPLAQARARLRYEELLEEAQPAIDAGLLEEEDFTHKEWVLSGRSRMGDLASVRGLVDSVNGISYSLSLIFLLVAAVICHSAISRMIEEQRVLIGTQKALGFTAGEILGYYMGYSLLCAGVGIGLGAILSFAVVQAIVVYIFSSKFLLGSIPLGFAWKEGLLAAALCLGIFLTTTGITCAKLVKLPARELLLGPAPAEGKRYFFESWKSYQKRSLYSRTMIKNMLNDPGRVMATVTGVIGCVSLLVICLSLKLAIDGAYVKQFEDLFFYENRLVVDSGAGDASDFEAVLEEEGISYARVQDKLHAFRTEDGQWMNGRILAVEEASRLDGFVTLPEHGTGEPLSVPERGLLVSRKCAEIYGLAAGSTLEFMDSQGNLKKFEIAGVIDHYLQYHLFVASSDYYREAMGEDADECVFLLQGDVETLRGRVQPMEGFLCLKDNSDQAEDTDAIYMAIAVFLALSVAMALLVLLNQIVIYISRKAKELAVMRINGYTLKETKAYIYKDNIVLTLVGLILGSGVGTVLSYIVIRIMEREPSSYIHTPDIRAHLFAWVVGSLFALAVNIIALKRIDKLNLTQVNSN